MVNPVVASSGKASSRTCEKQRGFTIVELLVVIVIISILATIAIVSYNGIISKTQETSVKHDMSNIAKQMEIYRVDEDRYPTSTKLQELGIKVNKQTYGVNPTGATIFYCVDSGVPSLVLLQE